VFPAKEKDYSYTHDYNDESSDDCDEVEEEGACV
jgi:hypothetical protein